MYYITFHPYAFDHFKPDTSSGLSYFLGSSGDQSWHEREDDCDETSRNRTFLWKHENQSLAHRQKHNIKSRLGNPGSGGGGGVMNQDWKENPFNAPWQKQDYEEQRMTRRGNQENSPGGPQTHPGRRQGQKDWQQEGLNRGGKSSWRDGEMVNRTEETEHHPTVHQSKARDRVFKMLNNPESKKEVKDKVVKREFIMLFLFHILAVPISFKNSNCSYIQFTPNHS